MTIQQLKSCRAEQYRLANLQERVERLRSIAERCTPQLSLGGGGGGTPKGGTLAEHVERLIEMEERLAERILASERELAEVEEWIDTLPLQQSIIMRLRYVDGLSWGDVAKRSGYSLQHCFTIHRHVMSKVKS